MRSLIYLVLLFGTSTVTAETPTPKIECSLSYYERAAHWEDDVDILHPSFTVTRVEKSDEIRGFRADARIVSVCTNGVADPCVKQNELHLRLSKDETEVETENLVNGDSSGPWSLRLKAGRFEQATILCSQGHDLATRVGSRRLVDLHASETIE